LDPEDHQAYQALAALYVQTGDIPTYRQICEQIRLLFGSVTNDPRIADRMAKSCLMLPANGADITTEARLANIAVTFDANSAASPWFQFCKGFADFRQGQFDSAKKRMETVLLRINDGSTRDVEAYMVLAMAEHGLQQTEAAESAFAKGKALAKTRLHSLDSGDIETGWTDWILANSLIREAENLVRAPSHGPADSPLLDP
jgi:hypothetical protein